MTAETQAEALEETEEEEPKRLRKRATCLAFCDISAVTRF